MRRLFAWLIAALLSVNVAVAADAAPKGTALVAGGTGKTGIEAVKAAQARGFKVRATTRNRDQARAAHPGVEWFAVDVRDPATLRDAMRGVTYVVSAIGASTWEGPESPQFIDYQGNVHLVDAAKAAGVKHFVMISSGSAGSHRDQTKNMRLGGILKWKTMAEEHLKASGLGYTIIGPAGLADGPPGDKGLRAVRRENYQSSYVVRADVARVAIHALLDPVAHGKSFALYNDGGATTEVWLDDLKSMAPDAALATRPSPLDGLAWLAGHWYAEGADGVTEELWLAPRGNTMPGLRRDLGRVESIAAQRIEARGNAVVLRIEPRDAPAREYTLTAQGREQATFTVSGNAGAAPRKLQYARSGITLMTRTDDGPALEQRLIGSK